MPKALKYKENARKNALIICGPTASGKTEFAHFIAQKHNGEIVNADSMQIYRQLPIITASPSAVLKEQLSYHLYNFQDVDKEFSATKYCHIASNIIKKIAYKDKLPIIVGGSGMYINMLINGYSDIPPINNEIREHARRMHKQLGAEKFFIELEKLDPESAFILNVNDTQRVIRSLEVILQTGKSILYFQRQGKFISLPDFNFRILLLMPERNFLYETCNQRFLKIFDAGGKKEVENLYKEYGIFETSAMKALGVAEIIAYVKDEISKEQAIEIATKKTRNYAKRQCTWFNNQLLQKEVLAFNSIDEYEQLFEKFSCQLSI